MKITMCLRGITVCNFKSNGAFFADKYHVPTLEKAAEVWGCSTRVLVSQEGRKRPVGTRFYGVKSSVLYLLRPLVPERGCCLTEHTISGDSRTDGFRVPPGSEMCGFVDA